MALADHFVLELLPLAGAVQVRREPGIRDEQQQAGDREEKGRR